MVKQVGSEMELVCLLGQGLCLEITREVGGALSTLGVMGGRLIPSMYHIGTQVPPWWGSVWHRCTHPHGQIRAGHFPFVVKYLMVNLNISPTGVFRSQCPETCP